MCFRHAITLWSLSFVVVLVGTTLLFVRDGLTGASAVEGCIMYGLGWLMVYMMSISIFDCEKAVRDAFWVGKLQNSVDNVYRSKILSNPLSAPSCRSLSLFLLPPSLPPFLPASSLTPQLSPSLSSHLPSSFAM